MKEQIFVFATLGGALALFVQNRLRYDVVAVLALLALVLAGVVAPQDAFLGFGHPAVVTVAVVLVLSKGLQLCGVVDVVSRVLVKLGKFVTIQVLAMTVAVAACSAFMNNVGALALLMPVAICMSKKSGRCPSLVLMPLAFGSLLGGMTTMIGTPPNIIIASFRAQTGRPEFSMFDFSPVGLAVALAGIVFVSFVGWRLIPKRRSEAGDELFDVKAYTTELLVAEGSAMVARRIHDIPGVATGEVSVLSLIRDGQRSPSPSLNDRLQPNDILVVEADSEPLRALVESRKFMLLEDKEVLREDIESDDVLLREVVVAPGCQVAGLTIAEYALRDRFGVNMLAISRSGARLTQRLGQTRLREGDVLLLQGPRSLIERAIREMGCWPLARRNLQIGLPRRMLPMVAVFAAALAASALRLAPVHIAMTAAAAIAIIVKLIPLREAYESVDWPVIVLLGALIPVGQAMETTGGAQLIADGLLRLAERLPPLATLAVVLIGTMFLSDLINNAAAAVLMAPIAIGVADGMNVSPDPFLMAVCIGASCAFLTPIGHQSNTLVMGPGGYKFGDYWRVGLPLEAIMAVVSLLLIPRYWPF